jgi:hypothetical protein
LFATNTVALPEPAAGDALVEGDAAGLAAGVLVLAVVEVAGGAVETAAPLVDAAEVAVDELEEPQAASVNASSNPTPSRVTDDRGLSRRFISSPFPIIIDVLLAQLPAQRSGAELSTCDPRQSVFQRHDSLP